MAECQCCGFKDPIGGLKETRGMASLSKDDPTWRICQICSGTHVFNMVSAPNCYNTEPSLAKSVAWIGNLLRKELGNRGAD